MFHHYRDITDKLGRPLWYDEAAVPRYCEFSPNETADIYAEQVALLEIACQSCGQRFKVAMSWSVVGGILSNAPKLSELIASKEIHFGDPPNNGCCPSGATMNSIPVRVLEFWRKGNKFREMVRVPELEIEVIPEWAEEL